MNILLINLTRFGDLLQMQPVILGLQAQGHNVGLVCLQNFAPAAKLLRGLSHVSVLSGGAFLTKLESDWCQALQLFDELLAQLVTQFAVDKILNTTATLSARLLSLRISLAYGGKPIEGFGLDSHGFGETGDMWTMYLQAASMERSACPFNLVDIFRSMAGVEKEAPLWGLQNPPTEIIAKAREFLQGSLIEGNEEAARIKGFVAFQLGASDERRQWPVENFAMLAHMLWEQCALCPVLLGTTAENELGVLFEKALHEQHKKNAFQPPYINAIGRTDILLLAGILTQTQLLVTNDTGTMHLAAGLQLPVLAIFLATAQACDTGPYLPNCCCLEPALDCHPCNFHDACVPRKASTKKADITETVQPCLRSITPNTALLLITHYIQNGVWPTHLQDDVRVWCTVQDAEGFSALESLSGHADEERTLWLRMQKHFYRRLFDSAYRTEYTALKPLSDDFMQALCMALHQVIALMDLLEGQLLLFSHKPHAEAGARIIKTSNKIQTLFEGTHTFVVFAYIWKHTIQQQGDDLVRLRDFVLSFRECMREWHESVCLTAPS